MNSTRYQKEARHGFQRNFDGLDFAIQPGMGVVTIQLESGATVRGRVLDPDGKPVASGDGGAGTERARETH